MAILDKLLGVGEAVRDKYKETFGDPNELADDGDDDSDAAAGDGSHGRPLDVTAAYAALGLTEGASLDVVREAYRSLVRYHHPIAHRDGVDSDAQRALDTLLEALELLEEHAVPLSGGTKKAPEVSKRQRATARAR